MANERRRSTHEFEVGAVELVTEQGYSVAEAARGRGIHENLPRSWKTSSQAEGDQAFPGKARLPAIEEGLRRPRADDERLAAERDVPKEAAAFFAGEAT